MNLSDEFEVFEDLASPFVTSQSEAEWEDERRKKRKLSPKTVGADVSDGAQSTPGTEGTDGADGTQGEGGTEGTEDSEETYAGTWETVAESEEVAEFEFELGGETIADEQSLSEEWETEYEDQVPTAVTYPSGVKLPIVTGPDASKADEFWDPRKSGIPLVDTSGAHRQKKISSHFTVAEFASSGRKQFPKSRLDPVLIKCIQTIRDRAGKPVTILSGYRSWAYNVALYKGRKEEPTKSRHCSGRAADISITGMSGMDIAKLAIDAWGPSVAVGIDKNSAHIDVRGRWARWTYKGVGDAAARARAKQEIDAYRRSKMAPTHGRPVPKPAAAAPAAPAAEFLKNVDELKAVALAPGEPIAVNRKWPDSEKAAAETYNRVGGLMGALATRLGVELPAVLAVWQVESGGRRHTPGKAIIRFENHLLFKFWGQTNTALYDTHFRHGGHAGQPGPSWKLHALRPSAGTPFLEMHRRGDQATEYRALELARKLAGDSIALQCISIGGPQILIANYRRLGFGTPRQMYDAFQTSERWHVIGFFDFCRTTKAPATGDMINYLRERNWERFAYYYNGKGQVANYSGHLSAAYEAARAVSVVRARESEWEEQGEAELKAEWENDPLSETWETVPRDEWELEGGNGVAS